MQSTTMKTVGIEFSVTERRSEIEHGSKSLVLVHGTVKEQKAFEKTLFQKTCKSDAEILLLDGLTIVFKANVDLLFYVIGSSNENELLLNT